MDADTLQRELNKTVLNLFQKKNSTFLSTLYCGMHFHWDETIPTACTDGLELRWNPQWFLSLDGPTRVSVLSHELWHVGYDHMGRAGERDFRLWNAACDHAINLQQLEHGYVFNVEHLADPRFTGWSAEQIYDKLKQESQGKPAPNLPFGEDFKPVESKEEQAKVEAAIIRAVVATRMAGEAGTLPGDLVTMVDKLLNPKLPWHRLLAKFLTDISNEVRSWKRPNRRYQDMYLPSNAGDEGLMHLTYAMDASGSMSDEQLVVLNTEIKSIKDTLNPEKMTVVSFDTQIRDTWEFHRDDSLQRLQFHGRGGTSLDPVWDTVKQNKASALVVFSDLDCAIPPSPGIPVIWVCMDNPTRTVPYGRIIHVDSREFSGT